MSEEQKGTLMEVGQGLSEKQLKRLTSMLSELSSEDLKMLKDMLVRVQGPSTQKVKATADKAILLEIIITALLEVNFSGVELKNLFQSFQQGNLNSREAKKYLSVLAPKLAAKYGVEAASPAATRPLSPTEQVCIKKAWNDKFITLGLNEKLISKLKVILERQDNQKPLFVLLEDASKDRQLWFLITLDKLQTQEKQDELLKIILRVNKAHPKVAQEICTGDLSVKSLTIATIYLFSYPLLGEFREQLRLTQEEARRLQQERLQRGEEPEQKEESREKKPSSGGGLLNSFVQMFSLKRT
ncbi:MAG: hypothetical protein AAFP88_01305 [Bacteroidota bacterium]